MRARIARACRPCGTEATTGARVCIPMRCRYAWSTWVAIVLTVLCFPLFVFLTETLALKVRRHRHMIGQQGARLIPSLGMQPPCGVRVRTAGNRPLHHLWSCRPAPRRVRRGAAS